MHVLPSSKEDRRELLTVPFKAYVFGVPIAVAACRIVSRITGQDLPDTSRYGAAAQIAKEDFRLFGVLIGGYVVCALALVVIGVVALSDQRSRKSALIWGFVAMAIAALLLFGSQPGAMR